MHSERLSPVAMAGLTAGAMAEAMLSNSSGNPFGPDTRTDAEVRSQAENNLPLNRRNRAVNRRRKAIKAKKAAKKARKANRRRK